MNSRTPSPTKEPATPTINCVLPQWNGLPSPQIPSLKNKVDHVAIILVHDNQSNSASLRNLRHDLELSEGDVEKQSSLHHNNDNDVRLAKSSQSEAQMESSSPKSLEDSSEFSKSTDDSASPFSSPPSTRTGSPPFNTSIQSRDDQQSSILSDELLLTIATASNGQAPTADQNLQVAEQDVELARAFEEATSPVPLRRSSRVSKKIKDKVAPQPVLVTTKIAAPKILSLTQLSTQNGNNKVGFKQDPICFNGLPTLHSVNWQLQYPAGGSTHPSYPYPNLDPRLVFHDGFVPQSDGLPDLSRVPKLFLPVGWKHVTWSGLIPIAFDPYRQAFKLTPVGPLPLTNEELNQNGLYKYVPGGELHPETLHLPKMIGLSDGSDGTVYNWEGVDWTLPWTEMNQSLDLYNTLPRRSALDGVATQVSGHSRSDIATSALSHRLEGWECPDGIVDLAEAWRWLREKELKPTLMFVPTVGKTWRGTGVHRASRKMKQPIPGLMAVAIANTAEKPDKYLVNQDTREFCTFRSVATPTHVNITLLNDTEITLQELLCYFPNHVYWRRAADRLCYAGLSGGDIANMINMTRCLSDDAARRGSTIWHQLRYETCEDGSRVKIDRPDEGKAGYTAQGWTYEACELTDYPLLALPHGLLSLPQGEDAGPLTKLIIWCRNQGRFEVLLSHVPALISEAGIDKTIERVSEECPDKRMLARHLEALKEDRKRVLEYERRKKRMAETKEKGRGKRKKTE